MALKLVEFQSKVRAYQLQNRRYPIKLLRGWFGSKVNGKFIGF